MASLTSRPAVLRDVADALFAALDSPFLDLAADGMDKAKGHIRDRQQRDDRA